MPAAGSKGAPEASQGATLPALPTAGTDCRARCQSRQSTPGPSEKGNLEAAMWLLQGIRGVLLGKVDAVLVGFLSTPSR